MNKTNKKNYELLINLYQIYVEQGNKKANTNSMMRHDDSGPGDPDYHCDTHDNYPTAIIRKRIKNGSN